MRYALINLVLAGICLGIPLRGVFWHHLILHLGASILAVCVAALNLRELFRLRRASYYLEALGLLLAWSLAAASLASLMGKLIARAYCWDVAVPAARQGAFIDRVLSETGMNNEQIFCGIVIGRSHITREVGS